MSDSLNNKELVAVGHQFAKAMSSDTAIMDIAKIVSRLAERLDCTTAALRKMTKQRDAEHTDVLVWEKTMFKVCGEDGPKSVADKFAELQANCAALAAENAGLKAAAEFATAPDMWEELGGNVMLYQYQEWYADNLKSAIQTPATDAFLAEVQAQGVEMFAKEMHADISEADALEFAAQLRQDAKTENHSLLSSEDCQAFVQDFTKGAA